MRFNRILLLLVSVVCMLMIGGCSRKSPDERLKQAVDFAQQGDFTSAEVEARKIIEKSPDDPASIQASMLLANIYVTQRRYDEAALELENTLPKVSQKDAIGKKVLATYLEVLQADKKYDEAIQAADKYQKEYASDPGTSLSLIVAKAQIQTRAGHTTIARQILSDIVSRTTSPAELGLYRQMTVDTYFADNNTTAAISYLQKQLAEQTEPDTIFAIQLDLARLFASQDSYPKVRAELTDATQTFYSLVKSELDSKKRADLALTLAGTYSIVGNRQGSRRVYQAAYESGLSDPPSIGATVQGLAGDLIALGETSATVGFLQDAARKYPTAPFGKMAEQVIQFTATGKIKDALDTSSLTTKFNADKPLWPTDLPSVLGVVDTGSSNPISSHPEATTTTSSQTTSAPIENIRTLPVENEVSATTAGAVSDLKTSVAR